MNPMKNYILRTKGTKKEILTALKNMQELIEQKVKTDEHTIQGVFWSWKGDKSGEMTADIKVYDLKD